MCVCVVSVFVLALFAPGDQRAAVALISSRGWGCRVSKGSCSATVLENCVRDYSLHVSDCTYDILCSSSAMYVSLPDTTTPYRQTLRPVRPQTHKYP